jgi:hypothetical protein
VSKRRWPAEHPTDKRPCLVCEVKPVVMKSTQVDQVGRCARCGAPYAFRDDAGEILELLVCALDPQLLEAAVEAWGSMHQQIELRPWLPCDWPTCDSASQAHASRIEVGDPILSDFERFIDHHRAGWLVRLDPEQLAERLTVTGRGRSACWVREVPGHPAKIEHGPLRIDPADLPEGSRITIEKPEGFPE